MYCGLGLLPFAVYVHSIDGINSRTANGEIVMPTAIVGSIILAGLIILTYKIATYFTLFFIDKDKKAITIIKPFLLLRKHLNYEDVIGFHFSEYLIRGQKIKILILKSVDNKIYRISDFEISNFRQIEKYLLDNFNLMRTDFVTKFTLEEKIDYLENTNRAFDLEQALEAKFTFIMLIGLVVFCICLQYANFGLTDRKFSVGIMIGVWALLFYFIYKLAMTFKTIKNCSQH